MMHDWVTIWLVVMMLATAMLGAMVVACSIFGVLDLADLFRMLRGDREQAEGEKNRTYDSG
ncbi:MAG: hypothetical protein ACE5O2_07370 [Armatimonadota bacterium]